VLQSYNKKATASSSDTGHLPGLAFDEDIKTYWAAKTGNEGEFLEADLGGAKVIRAIQLNYADHHAGLFGKQTDLYHQYSILGSMDGVDWKIILDKRENRSDVPNDYTELPEPVNARFVRVVNRHVPGGTFAISGFRVFGTAEGLVSGPVSGFRVVRQADRRNARLEWTAVRGAYAYNIYYGISPEKLYNCIMVIDQDHLDFRGLNIGPDYYFSIEAIGETGVSPRSGVVKAEFEIK